MIAPPTTSTTSIRHKPVLRWVLIALWVLIVIYIGYVFIDGIPQFLKAIPNESDIPLGNMDLILQAFFELGIDTILFAGYAGIAFILFFRGSDDWFAIFISIFLITFAGRISNVVNITAWIQGNEVRSGIILALGDISIVLFVMLFPTGSFAPKWTKYLIPFMVLTFTALYLLPNQPLYWGNSASSTYLILTMTWYLVAMISSFYRYKFIAGVHQKQQMRWVMIGTMSPLLWYLLFSIGSIFFENSASISAMGTSIFDLVARLLSLFAFLITPVFIAFSISRAKLFDIDLLIHRSLVYGGLTVGLALFFALTLGVTSLIFRSINSGEQSMVAMTISAVGVGAFFQPARKRLQGFIDKTLYNIKIDYNTPTGQTGSGTGPQTDITLSTYKDLKLIGRGGMASVYRSKNPVTGERVAVKILASSLAEDDQFRRRFMREAETVSSLSHKNIVRIQNYGEENGVYYIVMEYLSGPNLHTLLKEEKQLSLAHTVRLLKEVAEALDYAHQRGLVHRDIKPSNIMLDVSEQQERAVLTDFGIVKIADAHTSITASRVLGTFDYIAPEQIQSSEKVDGRADVYALGVMAYQILGGAMPFERSNTGALLLAHLSAPPPDLSEIAPHIPREVSYAIQRAMAKTPEERFETAGDFVAALSPPEL